MNYCEILRENGEFFVVAEKTERPWSLLLIAVSEGYKIVTTALAKFPAIFSTEKERKKGFYLISSIFLNCGYVEPLTLTVLWSRHF